MQKFTTKIATAFMVVAFAAPMIASAETGASLGLSSETQTKIQTLLSQIKMLQDQLRTLVASSTKGAQSWGMGSSTGMGMPPGQMGKMACITLSRNLRQGDQGDDVKKLQEMLKEDSSSGFSGNTTGFFGPLTMKAMMKFQMGNGIASSTDGSVGPITRGFFERRCGKGLDGMQGKMPGNDMMMGMAIRGTISAAGATSITVQNDGSSVVANIVASTTIKIFASTSTPPTPGSISDLTVGKKVMVEGAKNSDGSIQARMIAVGDFLPMIKMEIKMMDNNDKPPMGVMPPMNLNGVGPGPNMNDQGHNQY